MDEAEELRSLRNAVAELLDGLNAEELRLRGELDSIHPNQRDSARNLIHYTKLRDFDLRSLQERLSRHGLSSLGRSESRVMFNLAAVLRTLSRLTEHSPYPAQASDPSARLSEHTVELLGPGREGRKARIMVTAPSEAAYRPELISSLLETGMDILRINCAHDGPSDWIKMAEHARRAQEASGRVCRILCDLSGPKLRTGILGRHGKGKVLLQPGDHFFLTADPKEKATRLACVPCATPEILKDLRPGQPIWFDDGKIGAKIVEVTPERALILVLRTPPHGAKLKSDKGINLPETALSLPTLSEKDQRDLDTIIQIADMVGQSFIRSPEDVINLSAELARRNASHLGVILKIETPGAFSQLPAVLLSGMRHAHLGVMVARGDLAVEVGFERLAEVQEEILWMCEAAHAPLIWATQVLETLAKEGQPTRAEVTDAAMSSRAECVMLNKGPYIEDAVRFLSDVLSRMDSHQSKKHPMLRKLNIAGMTIPES